MAGGGGVRAAREGGAAAAGGAAHRGVGARVLVPDPSLQTRIWVLAPLRVPHRRSLRHPHLSEGL